MHSTRSLTISNSTMLNSSAYSNSTILNSSAYILNRSAYLLNRLLNRSASSRHTLWIPSHHPHRHVTSQHNTHQEETR